jgi:hypothetical protein
MLNSFHSAVQHLPSSMGPIGQICFITNDIPASVNTWAKIFGAGPFFHMEHVDLQDVTYRGQPIELDESIAIGYWNDLQIEFIHQHNDSPTIFTDWTTGKRSGLHHGLIYSADVEVTRAELAKAGMTAAQEMRIGAGGECIFFDTGFPELPFLEVVRLDPIFDKLFDYMKQAAREWDGTNPLRPVPDPSVWA